MEWYRNDRVDDLGGPSNQCARSSFPSPKRWKQWGLNTIDECDASLDSSYAFGNTVADEGDFSCVTLLDVDQLDLGCLVDEGDQAEISGVRGDISESSNAPLNNQDYQLDGFPWTNQTDENFLNSLLVDDLRAGDQFQNYGSPNLQGTYSTANNLTTDMLLDSHDMGSYEQMDSPMFPYTFDWDKEQSDAPLYDLRSVMINTAPQYNVPLESIPQQARADGIVRENPSVEETVLREFGSAVQKMTQKSRLCFRDAMYCLAMNSEKQSSILLGEHGGNSASERPYKTSNLDQTLRFLEKDVTEPRTNAIDRTIADLLFNKPYQHVDCHQDLNSAAKSHNRHPSKQSLLTLQPAVIRGRLQALQVWSNEHTVSPFLRRKMRRYYSFELVEFGLEFLVA